MNRKGEENYLSMRINADQAAEIAERMYGISGEVTALAGEIDFNFRIRSDSASHVLKVSRPDVVIGKSHHAQTVGTTMC